MRLGYKLIVVGLSGLVTTLFSTAAWSETVLERVDRTGVLTAGTRTDSIPFAYINDNGEWVGYSIDLLGLIHDRLEQKLAEDIELNLVEVTAADRIAKVQEEAVDIVCGSTTYTASRARRVDFSLGFYQTGTQFLARQAEPLGRELQVGIIAGTTNAAVVENYLRLARFVIVENRAAGLAALNAGRIDLLASDGILLEGLRQTTRHPDAYVIIPSFLIQPEVYGCILPKGNPEFLTLVNQTIIDFMQGVLDGDDCYTTILNTWFGEVGVVQVEPDRILNFFEQTVETYGN